MGDQILHLENGNLSIDLRSDFSATLTDKVRDVDWRMSPCCFQEIGPLSDSAVWNRQERCYMDRYPSFFEAVRLDDTRFRVTVLDDLRHPRGGLVCRLGIDGEWIVFTLEAIDEELPSLIFPPYIESESLVIPRGIGQWHRTPIAESTFIMPASGWNMRWFGGLRGDSGWLTVVEEGYADAGVYLSQMTACTAWQKSLGSWSCPRSVRIGLTGNGYVGLAKRFRAYARENDLHTTLREKIEARPSVGNLIGGRCVSFFQAFTRHTRNAIMDMRPTTSDAESTDGRVEVLIPHRDVATIMDEARQAGMKRGYFNLRGWLKGGYDETHPDVWPPEPALGTLDEFKAVTGRSGRFFTALHDNYQDIYPQAPSFPQWVMRNPDSTFRAGGTWHGGRCYVVNPAQAINYAKRNWEEMGTLGLGGAFLDTIGGAHFQEDFSPDHRLTRTGDAESKLEIARFHKSLGLVVGTEIGSDFCMPDVDFIETRQSAVPGVTIPLFPLVYHDSVVTLRYNTGTDDFAAARDIEDILWGYAKLWPAGNLANWRANRDAFVRSLRVDAWHERIGLDEMITHRYLNDAGTVEQTEFSSGVSVTANFSGETITVSGRAVEPGEWGIHE